MILKESISGFLKHNRFTVIVYNFLNRRRLRHNARLYRKHGIAKPVYWNISSIDFSDHPSSSPWLDEPDAAAKLAADPLLQQFDHETQEQLKSWVSHGYMIFKNFLSKDQVESINREIDRLKHSKTIEPLPNGKLMFAFHHSEFLDDIVRDQRFMHLFSYIFRQPVFPFQSINFDKGSQQRAHSDSIHMTTFPLGYLAAAWFALEDVKPDNGPLFYYPGSHRLPYFLNPSLDVAKSEISFRRDRYTLYEDAIDRQIQQTKIPKERFLASAGDVLIWHANLLHGGEPIHDPLSTRKSMVVHYFGQNVIKYHEISGRPALVDEKTIR